MLGCSTRIDAGTRGLLRRLRTAPGPKLEKTTRRQSKQTQHHHYAFDQTCSLNNQTSDGLVGVTTISSLYRRKKDSHVDDDLFKKMQSQVFPKPQDHHNNFQLDSLENLDSIVSRFPSHERKMNNLAIQAMEDFKDLTLSWKNKPELSIASLSVIRGLGKYDVASGRSANEHYSRQQVACYSTQSTKSDNRATVSVGAAGRSLGKPPSPVRLPPSRVLGRSKIPTPKSAPPVSDNPLANLPAPKSLMTKGVDLMLWVVKSVFQFFWKLPGNIYFYTVNATERKALWTRIQDTVKHEVNHYWVGTKLLWADIQTSRDLLNKTLGGSSLTRRERRQLLRTVSDLFRLVPFSMFIIIPFMEFALPFALRIFPNLLPSTFQDSLKAEESVKRELQSRIAMTQFFQETLEELAKEQKSKAKRRREELIEAGVDLEKEGDNTIENQEDSAASMLEFLEKARNGEMIPPDVIIRYANYFQDDLHIDNIPRMQLINMCKYMGIHPYGSDAFLRFQLRHKIRILKEDDQRILWEGIDSLTKMELREACRERGMRSTGLSKDAYKDLLQQWIDLSVSKSVPISLLIMSRTFFLREDMFQRKKPKGDGKEETTDSNLTGLADAISGMDKEVLNEVILEVATSEEKLSDPLIRKLKLEVVAQQNALIREEQEAREAEAKKKESEQKERTVEEHGGFDEAATKAALNSSSGETSIPDNATTKSSTDGISTAANTEEKEKSVEAEEDRGISAQEADALRELLSDDPVEKERADLEKLKAAIKSKEGEATQIDPDASSTSATVKAEALEVGSSPIAAKTDTATFLSKPELSHHASSTEEIITDMSGSTVSIKEKEVPVVSEENLVEEFKDEEEQEDPVVRRLKKRIESMVDKIEVQLSQAKTRIGDKMKILDKDRDGILSKEEMASVLQEVFKRKISFEDAMEIASEMDDNHDGIFTVEECLNWIEEKKLVKFVEEGRDHEMDLMMESQNTDQPPEDLAKGPSRNE